VPDAYGTAGSWRTVEVTTRLTIREATGAVRAWVPVPLLRETDYFRRAPDHWTGNCTAAPAQAYDQYGTGGVVASREAGEPAPVLAVISRFRTRDRQGKVRRPSSPLVPEDATVLQYFRQPSTLIRPEGIVAKTATEIIAGRHGEVEQAQALSAWIVDPPLRDPTVKGCGLGDITARLETGYGRGKCADLNALFVGLARAAGLPAREV
jgi:transglutaminase-like putative cysteine protease